MTRVIQSSQRFKIFESESSPSHQKNTTRVDSSPSHDSDSPSPGLLLREINYRNRKTFQSGGLFRKNNDFLIKFDKGFRCRGIEWN